MTENNVSTIVALASAAGRAGVAVLRLSGPRAAQALQTITKRDALPAPRMASLRDLFDPRSGEVIDHALILWFPAPHSFTGEDVVELHIHGGRAVLNATLAALCAIEGVRPAEAGEFSRRAFENGKMDLTEAEGIADLVDAETAAQRRQALRQMDGALGHLYHGWADRLTQDLAYIEAEIDFADEDIPPDLSAGRREDVAALAREIEAHLQDNRRGERLREGFTVALLGAPNAGKSSLLNALARREAAIVSPIPGTTRDIIEVQLDLGGFPVELADTAGLRETADAIESEGVRRALARAEAADLKLLVFDGTQSEPDPATLALVDETSLIVVNKIDVAGGSSPCVEEGSAITKTARHSGETFSSAPQGTKERLQPESDLVSKENRIPDAIFFRQSGRRENGSGMTDSFGLSQLLISAKTGEGLDALTARLIAEIEKRFVGAGQPALTRARHRVALEECHAALVRALSAPEVELCAEDLRLAIRALGRITGRVDVEDILEVIFSSFCIGK